MPLGGFLLIFDVFGWIFIGFSFFGVDFYWVPMFGVGFYRFFMFRDGFLMVLLWFGMDSGWISFGFPCSVMGFH